MTEPPAPDQPPDDPAPHGAAEADARWEKLNATLAARARQHTGVATPPPPTAKKLLPLMQAGARSLVWNLTLFFRWLKPRLIDGAIVLLALLIRLVLYLFGLLKMRERGERLIRQSGTTLAHLKGWLIWQWRSLKVNPDKRLAVFGLIGGFTLPLTLFIVLSHLFPPADPMAPYIDPSVPVPAADFIDVSPGEDTSTETAPITTGPEPLTPANFRFELFTQRTARGDLQLLSHVAQHYIDQWYPKGTPAVQFMRFFGETMVREGGSGEATIAARQRCLSMPTLKAFTERTVTCTYGHGAPAPIPAGESAQTRIFWIIALSYDRSGKITDLRVHARLTRAAL